MSLFLCAYNVGVCF